MLTSGFFLQRYFLLAHWAGLSADWTLMELMIWARLALAMRSFGHALVGGTVYDAKGDKGGLGPDVAARAKLEEVEAVNTVELDAREVSEGLLDAVVGLTCG